MKQGREFMTKSLFRWKTDPEQASRHYREAVKLFRACGDDAQDRLLEALYASAEAHSEIRGGLHQAGADYEEAARLEDELKHQDQCFDAYKKSAEMYERNESWDKASKMRTRAAFAIADVDWKVARMQLEAACKLFLREDRPEFHEQVVQDAVRLCFQNKRMTDALAFLHVQLALCQRLIDVFFETACKAVLECVLISLQIGDLQLAEQEYQNGGKSVST